MVTTAYDYITLAELELYAGYDFSALDAVKFHDDIVNGTIGVVEKMVNSYKGKDGAQTVTDGIETAVTIITTKILMNRMSDLGYSVEGLETLDLVNMSVRSILKMFLGSDIGVDNIPMSGADN